MFAFDCNGFIVLNVALKTYTAVVRARLDVLPGARQMRRMDQYGVFIARHLLVFIRVNGRAFLFYINAPYGFIRSMTAFGYARAIVACIAKFMNNQIC